MVLLWLDNDNTTLQQEAVSSALGVTATTLNRCYDWGVEEECRGSTDLLGP